jgi:hypothetical protein
MVDEWGQTNELSSVLADESGQTNEEQIERKQTNRGR